MSNSIHNNNYVVISPVKDEEKYAEKTIKAILRQTIRPSAWVIVDDGSQDRTPDIIRRYAEGFDWIKTLRMDRGAHRQLGLAEIRAFDAGYELLRAVNFDFVVKLDCDLDLPRDYFERLIARFQEDDRLGIASGIYLEYRKGSWIPVEMPAYHAAGASKMIRAACLKEIGGFILHPGWDTLDEIRAQMRGWTTRHFQDISFYHLKNEGAGMGPVRTNLFHGEIYYFLGGGKLFFLLKILHRMVMGKPFLWGGLAMLWGFVKTWLSGKEIPVTDSEARFYRQLLTGRILNRISAIFGCGTPKVGLRSI